MTKLTLGSHPYLLGFEQLERLLERNAKSGNEGYPPFNIEQTSERGYRITLAVAGFSEDDLSITVEDRQLVIRDARATMTTHGFSCTAESPPANSSALSCWPTGWMWPVRKWKTDYCTSTWNGQSPRKLYKRLQSKRSNRGDPNGHDI